MTHTKCLIALVASAARNSELPAPEEDDDEDEDDDGGIEVSVSAVGRCGARGRMCDSTTGMGGEQIKFNDVE